MKRKHIILFQDKDEFGYHLMENEDGMPYYVPDDQIEFEEGVNTDSVLFLPIEEKTFARDRKNKFVGFRLRFDSASHQTVVFGIDPNNLSWTDIQVSISINRIIYTIDRYQRLIVREERDPMVPPTISSIHAPSASIGEVLLELMQQEIDLMGNWVFAHKI